MTGSKIVIDIFLRKSPDQEKIAYAILKNLKFEGLQTGIHVNESNSISYYFSDKRNLPEKIKKIEKIKEIENFILGPDPRQEILDALSDHDYFKAFALCSTVYEFLAKTYRCWICLMDHIETEREDREFMPFMENFEWLANEAEEYWRKRKVELSETIIYDPDD